MDVKSVDNSESSRYVIKSNFEDWGNAILPPIRNIFKINYAAK